mmetsp:Transcript_13123/g.15772  ORF Transcript_13123/g.15772 Transcript_13123/m.15772 type:complete len:89 (-) Transcript_13123:3-269(-)
MTTPSLVQIPNEVRPFATAFNAYSICNNLPVRENVVNEKEYAESPILNQELCFLVWFGMVCFALLCFALLTGRDRGDCRRVFDVVMCE